MTGIRRDRCLGTVAGLLMLLALAACGSAARRSPSTASTAGSSATVSSGAAPTRSEPASTVPRWPDSIVVLGHSGATGQNSDPVHPGADAPQNSWATGSNPRVQSVYLRLLARNAGVKNHAANYAQDGATVTDLAAQAREALARTPRPNLFLIQTIDNDIRCDGTDPQNYTAFAVTLTATLRLISTRDPQAWIFLVSQPGDVANNAAVAATKPAWVKGWQGTGPCDAFDLAGKRSPAHIAGLQDITDHYFAAQESSCKRFLRCRADNRAWQRMVVRAADFSDDGNHPSIAGLAKRADVTWSALRAAGVLPGL